MTRDEALRLIETHKGWNIQQKSASLAFNGVRTEADDVFDARRKALRSAYELLNSHEAEGHDNTD